MKLVLDTNIVVSGILWKGKPGQIIEKWLSGRFTLLLSEQLLTEYVEVLERVSGQPELAATWKGVFVKEAVFVQVGKIEKVSRDPDDDMVLALGLTGHADAIVSGDRDLLDIKDFPLTIQTPAAFLRANPAI